jgi:spore coat protein U-like protein
MKSLFFALRALRPCLLALLLMVACVRPAVADGCSVSGSSMSFGDVHVLDGGQIQGSMPITIGCNGNPGKSILVCVSLGANPSGGGYAPRYLVLDGSSPAKKLAFNMYADSTYSTIWGAVGASGSYPPVAVVFPASSFTSSGQYVTQTMTINGLIKASDLSPPPSAGTYSTNGFGNWPLWVSYKAYPVNATPPTCSSGGLTTSTTNNFYISANVVSDCRLVSSTNLDFGTVYETLSNNVDATAAIAVTCNGSQGGNTPYYVFLDNGLNPNGDQRRMKGPNNSFLNYELYKDTARSIRWGNTTSTGAQATGNGQPQTMTVYGRVPAQAVPAAGKYTDTVVITLSY